MCQELNSQLFLIPKGLKVESIYSQNTSNGLMVEHIEFGELISYKLFYNDKIILEVSPDNQELLYVVFVIELWHDIMVSNLISKKINDFDTLITEETDNNYFTYDFNYFLSTINHTINNEDSRYNSTSFLKFIATKKDIAITKEMLLITLDKLVELGIPIIQIDNKTQEEEQVQSAKISSF